MATEEMSVLSPANGFWLVTVEVVDTDESGKEKKLKELHLVDGVCPTDAEKKVADMMSSMSTWKIKTITESKIQYVY